MQRSFRANLPLIVLLSAFVYAPSPANAVDSYNTQKHSIVVETVADGLDQPWGMTELPDGSILVTEKGGKLWRIENGNKTEVTGLPNISATGQGGLLDIAADEDFQNNRKIYFTWSEPGPGGSGTALSSARLSDDNQALEDLTLLFSMNKKSQGGRHFGSRIILAPEDKIFITTGDRGEPDRAQDYSDHAGAVIRLNRDGSVPDDNPHAAAGDNNTQPELWSKGHRNPQGADLNPQSGELWIIEHGARGGDEVNIPVAGKNYGWPEISYGRHYSGQKIGQGFEAPGFEQPIWYWDPSIAPSGAAFYDGDLFPEWQGDLLVAALKFQMLVRLEVDGDQITGEERLLEDRYGRIRDVEVFSDGAVYLLTDSSDGRLLRITPG